MNNTSSISPIQKTVDALKESFSVRVDAPYSFVFETGHVSMARSKSGYVTRRYINFKAKSKTPDETWASRLPASTTTYARYLMNCHLWKTEGRILADDEEVDHVNGNALDDILDNFEIVSREENILRRDHTRYAACGIMQHTLDTLHAYLKSGENRRYIANEMGITMGYLRYLIHTYFPDYNSHMGIERDVNDIITRRKEGETCQEIADTYGVDYATIQRLITKYAPELTGAALKGDRRAYIAKRVGEKAHYNDISKELGCTPVNVWYYIKKFHPEYAAELSKDVKTSRAASRERALALIEKAEPFIRAGVTYREIGEYLNVSGIRLAELVTKYRKDIKPKYKNRPKSECPSVQDVLDGKINN